MDNGASSYRRFLDGDESAFGCIMRELFHGLVFFIDGFVHDTQAAEDIAIDTFSDLIVHRHRYNFKVSLKTYLYMVGRSRALDYLKHRKTTRFVEISEANEISDDSASLEEMVLADERKRLIHGAIGQLPEEMRVAVHLVYFEEMTYEETAKVMKKNRKQVDNLLYRAKKALRITLEKNGESVL
jgi:RNA polymerase sigma-70 factor (ECF subfamily)